VLQAAAAAVAASWRTLTVDRAVPWSIRDVANHGTLFETRANFATKSYDIEACISSQWRVKLFKAETDKNIFEDINVTRKARIIDHIS